MSYNDSVEEYLSADEEIDNFNIFDKCITYHNKKTIMVELTFRELLNYSDSWSYNRKIIDEKTIELYNTLCENYDIPWTLHAIYDTSICNSIKKILILDGQHRKKAIEYFIQYHDAEMICDKKVWVWLYILENSETTNSSIALNLFKKINNNRQFEEDELPNMFVIDLIQNICKNKTLKCGIKTNDANSTSHAPYIHKKELNAVLNENVMLFQNMTHEDILNNMIIINHKLSMKTYEQLYGKNKLHLKRFERAIALKFYLNLGKFSKYPITKWIKYINNVQEMP